MRKNITKPSRINRQIRSSEVRVIGEGGEQLGVLPIEKALQIASEGNVDLVEVAANADPPVCRLLDYGQYKYEQTKKERKARLSQRAGLLKEIRIRPRVNKHDLETKIRIAKKLLDDGNKVRVFVVFRGREITHPELGLNALQKVADDLKGAAALESSPSLSGGVMSMVFSPISAKQSKETMVKEET